MIVGELSSKEGIEFVGGQTLTEMVQHPYQSLYDIDEEQDHEYLLTASSLEYEKQPTFIQVLDSWPLKTSDHHLHLGTKRL